MAKKKINTKKSAQPKKKTEAPKEAPQQKKTEPEKIVLRKFEQWQPQKPFTPKKTEFKKDFTAPKFIKGNNKKLKEILLKDFSNIFSGPVNESKVEAPPVKEIKPENISKNDAELIKREEALKQMEAEILKKKEDVEKKESEAASKLAEAEKALADAKTSNSEADSKLEEANKAKQELEAKEQEIQTKISDAEAKISEAENLKKEAEALKADAEGAKKTAEQAKADADKAKDEAEKKAAELKKAEEELQSKKAELEKIEKDAVENQEKAKSQLEEAQNRESEAARKLKDIEAQKKDFETEKEALSAKEKQIKAKEEELAQKEEELNKTIFTKVSESAQKLSAMKPDFSKIKNPKVKETNDNGGLMNKGILGLIAGFGFLVIILVAASISNTGNFYLSNSKDGLMVFQGKFAPKGKFHLMTLPEIYAPSDIKNESYEKKEVYSLIYSFYMDKVKELAKTKGTPDIEEIEKNLEKALAFAPSLSDKKLVREQISTLGNVSASYKTELLNVLEGEKQEAEVKAEKPAAEIHETTEAPAAKSH
ncbi:MAG: hypothetical protein H6680_04405 [Desulfobacteraceae bacterium]|nr:hypothetical protein [Desulfobacteraceae bacterium]